MLWSQSRYPTAQEWLRKMYGLCNKIKKLTYVHVPTCVHRVCVMSRGQKRTSDPFELELQAIARYEVWH